MTTQTAIPAIPRTPSPATPSRPGSAGSGTGRSWWSPCPGHPMPPLPACTAPEKRKSRREKRRRSLGRGAGPALPWDGPSTRSSSPSTCPPARGLEERAHAQAVAEGIPGREADVVRLARVAVESPIVGRAVASGRMWREVPVATPIGQGSLQGFIDLLFEEPDGLVVVDYKTDSLSPEEAGEAVARYRLQGGAYAHAVGEITGKPVKEVVFLYLQPRTGSAAGGPVPGHAGSRGRGGAGAGWRVAPQPLAALPVIPAQAGIQTPVVCSPKCCVGRSLEA